MEAARFQELCDIAQNENRKIELNDGKRNYTLTPLASTRAWIISVGELMVCFDTCEPVPGQDGWMNLRTGWHTAGTIKIAKIGVKE